MPRPASPPPDPPPDDLVPSRRQYLALKAQHLDALLLYRLGDFYETFDDDARVLARDARVTLTSRSFGRSGRAPMAGIPHHALNSYLARLLAAGHTIAIAEQVSPPGKGLVRREVTRVLSPGAIADPALLPAGENRWLAAICARGGRIGLSWADISTGEWMAVEWQGEHAPAALAEELARLAPAETLLPDDRQEPPWLDVVPGHRRPVEAWFADPVRAEDALRDHFGVQGLHAFGLDGLSAAVGAAGMILAWLERASPALVATLAEVRAAAPEGRVGLDAATRRNLELTRSFGTGGSRGSLLGVLDATRTAMGARALRRIVGEPLRDLDLLRRRQALVGALTASPETRMALAAALAGAGDPERLLGRVAGFQATPRDLTSLAAALRRVPAAGDLLAPLPDAAALPEVALPDCADVLALLDAAVETDADEGGRIRRGFAPELDAAVDGAAATRRWLAELEGRERQRTGIRSLKVGFTKVFGYYIEVTRPNLGAVPAEYERKQTIAAGERFVTAALKEAEARILAADEEIATLERAAVERVCAEMASRTARLQRAVAALARLDALLALAETAACQGWIRPELTEGNELEIRGGRHPVVEAALAGEPFIPNDCLLGSGAPRQIVLTGPNMGGKSTWLRQVGLIVLLAQIGSFVPAAAARIGLVDRIFTRVGAHDDLARGQSTFMVEMVETAAILRGASERSLLLLDEIGRGTSTNDGLAIARATLEDISRRIGARCLFATHYLELTALAGELPDVANAHVAVLETEGRVVFLYAVHPGPADRAYGVHVARLAGLPPWVADRAEALLTAWDAADSPRPAPALAEPDPPPYDPPTPSPPNPASELAVALRALDLDEMSARDALRWLWAARDRLEGPADDAEVGDTTG
ncbi:MAG: DNA mismatch repair protein MutS [Thermomicrobiales bacterium]|nr:DNA mismatch repair protein MutS [Thermomicrobiales bacterium]